MKYFSKPFYCAFANNVGTIYNKVLKTAKPRKGELYHDSTLAFKFASLFNSIPFVTYAYHLHLRLKILTDLEAALITSCGRFGIISGVANRLYPFGPTSWGVTPFQ